MTIKFIYKWNGCWNVISKYFFITHSTEDLDYTAKNIFVCYDKDFFVFHYGRADSVLPEGNYTINALFQRLASWKNRSWQHFVLCVKAWMHVVIPVDWWRLQFVASSPLKDLCVSKLFRSLLLVQTLKLPIVFLIESPMLLARYPVEVHLIDDAVV